MPRSTLRFTKSELRRIAAVALEAGLDVLIDAKTGTVRLCRPLDHRATSEADELHERMEAMVSDGSQRND